MAHPGGRPTDYTPELADEICDKIATSPRGLIALCAENPHWPSRETIYAWKRSKKEFSDKYTQAKIDQIEPLVDECIDIADDTSQDTLVRYDHNGDEYETCNNEFINRSRLRIDTRKWFASKLAPKIYGDKKTTEGTLDVLVSESQRKVRDAEDKYK
jgi:hypothetical protein